VPAPFAQAGTVSQLKEAITALCARDEQVEQQKARWSKKAGIGWLLVFLGFIGIIGGGMSGFVPLIVLGALVFVAGLVTGIVCSVRASRLAKEDCEDRRLELAGGLLDTVGQDVPAKASMNLDMSFDAYQTHGQLVSEDKQGGFYPVTARQYRDNWFQASGRLNDGNRFKLAVTQLAKRKEKRKPKYTKVSEQVYERISLTLRVSSQAYPGWQALKTLLSPGVAEGFQILRAQVDDQGVARVVARTPALVTRTGRYGTQTLSPGPLTTTETVARLFMYVYERMQQCRGSQVEPAADTPQ